MDRRSADRRRPVPPEPDAVPMEQVPAHVAILRELQSAVGNARVSRMLATVGNLVETSQERGTDVAPHEPGDTSEDLLAVASRPGGLAAVFGAPAEAEAEGPDLADVRVDAAPADEQERAPTVAKAPGPVPDPELVRWAAVKPSTNKDMAVWLLDGEKHGFVKFWPFYHRQLEDIAAEKDTLEMYVHRDKDTSKTERRSFKTGGAALPVLTFLVALTRARADRWLADTSQDKTFVEAGELIRKLPKDAHDTGKSADLFPHFDWNGANGPAQVIEVLDALPAGTYLIGLPMQGQFFPKSEYLASRQEKSIADAGPGGTPADITQPSLIYWRDQFYTSKYDAAKGAKYPWTDTGGGSGVATRLRSAALKADLGTLAGKGTKITVFPDYDNHIHVQAA